MPFVVDASAALAWCFTDEATAETAALLRSLQNDHAAAPATWPSELANVLHMASRRGRISLQEVDEHLMDLSALPVRVEGPPDAVTIGVAITLARAHRLTVYDALYLEIALRLHFPLATLDDDLKTAAKGEGVKLLL